MLLKEEKGDRKVGHEMCPMRKSRVQKPPLN